MQSASTGATEPKRFASQSSAAPIWRFAALPSAFCHSSDDAALVKRQHDFLRQKFRWSRSGGKREFRLLGRLVEAADAGEIRQLAGARQLVKPFRIARLAYIERRIDVNLNELVGADELACHAALAAERRNEADDDDQPSVHHKLRHLGNAADILHAILVGEA